MLESTLLTELHCNTSSSKPVDQTQPFALVDTIVVILQRFRVDNNVGKCSTVHMLASKGIVVVIVKHVLKNNNNNKKKKKNSVSKHSSMMVHYFREIDREREKDAKPEKSG